MKRTAGKQLWDIRPKVSASNFLLTCFLFKFAPLHNLQISLNVYFFLQGSTRNLKGGKAERNLDLAFHKRHLRRNCLPSHTHALRMILLKSDQSTDGKTENQAVLTSLSPQQHPAPSRSPAGSASLGTERQLQQKQQRARRSLAQIAQTRNTPRRESSGMR